MQNASSAVGHSKSEPPHEETITRPSAYSLRPDGLIVARNRPTVVFMTGPRMGEACRLPRGETTIGRGRHCGIRLDEHSISRTHLRIVVERNRVLLADMGSSNGTLVNGARITMADLNDGDKIQLGESVILKFVYTDPLDDSFHNQLYNAAMRDALTGAFNRSYLVESLDKGLAYARRHNAPVAVLMFDIDFFKTVNDNHGHLAGDAVLQYVSRAMRAGLRAEDVFARYGGEEFCIVCPGTPLNGAVILAERLRKSMESARIPLEKGQVNVTMSAGVAAFPEVRAITSTELVGAADAALLRAKSGGRNRVAFDGDDDEAGPDSAAMPTQTRVPISRVPK